MTMRTLHLGIAGGAAALAMIAFAALTPSEPAGAQDQSAQDQSAQDESAQAESAQDQSGRDKLPQDKIVPDSREEVQLSFAPVVQEAAPAVVNVYAKRIQKVRAHPFAGDPFFRRFFGDDAFGMPRERVRSSLGSGVIVRSDGIIVTNHHVIKNGEAFKVVLNDRREFDAEVLLTDKRTDLAVLKIDAGGERLPTLRFHDSDAIEVGDLVLAIGNPFGVGQTVTSGIVSALARTQVGVADYRFFIQTDAPINPGNSGGALVTLDGALLGINTAIYSRSGGSIGIGFAIPANMVRLVVDSAVEGKRLVRSWLGVASQKVSSQDVGTLQLDRPGGALITRIFPGGPADKAGLRAGDVVVSVAGFDIADPQGMRYRTATQKPGSKVDITYIRDGERRKGKVKLTLPPEDPPRKERRLEGRHPLSGATVANLSPAFNEELGIDPLLQGVVVLRTEPRSPARRTRFRPGDIVLAVNDEEIERVEQLEQALEDAPYGWEFELRRGDRVLTAMIRP
ncbi:MAG: DegQ family serine endoprotease [Alphaproteobacteria bacterium]